jgi:NitT/TauT family transport system ATP-binding protein
MSQLPPLPHAPIGQLIGLLEAMHRTPEADSISSLAQSLLLDLEDLLPLVEAAKLLDWAYVDKGHYDLTPEGRRVVEGDEVERRRLFCAHASRTPLLRMILTELQGCPGQPVPREQILGLLESAFPQIEAERQLATAINWGRYGEMLDYDADEEALTLGPCGRS